ncbi:MAG TPA: hypothetical protein ENI55_04680 [Alphaproteobacteria bacterium]|nr:hypothetical protein [Alphaproteobacteria bacterium]
MTTGPIDYEALVTEYQSGLVDKLRNFGPAADFLELWVPDADLAESLVAMVDAAAAAGTVNFALFIDRRLAARLNMNALSEALQNQASIACHDENGGKVLEFFAIHAARPTIRSRAAKKIRQNKSRPDAPTARPAALKTSDEIADAYAAALKQTSLAFEGKTDEKSGLVMVQAEADGAILALLVEPAANLIHMARHRDAAVPERAALLDRFCALIEGLPILEASDHGTIRLEARLRDHASAVRPVPGVVSPEAAWPGFALPRKLILGALATYRKKTGFASCDNDFDPGATEEWMGLDDKARRQKLAAVIDAAEATVTDIEHDVRVVVHFAAAAAGCDKQRQMMKMEQTIKTNVEPRLELYLEELKDANPIRRRTGAEDAK